MWELCLVSVGLGVGLAMDACAVSMSNGMNEPKMRFGKSFLIAATFAFFQALMPMIGWVCVTLVATSFEKFTVCIPYVALALLAIIGGKMLYDGIKDARTDKKDDAATDSEATSKQDKAAKKLTVGVLLAQAVATSIDALSTGFSLASDNMAGNVWWKALVSAGIIAAVTFGICVAAVYLGKKFGAKLGNKAQIVGGAILIIIGLEIFIKSFI